MAIWRIPAFFLLLLAMSFSVRAEQASPRTLEVGVFPYLSTRAILGTYRPLQEYLEKQLQRPVLIVTAPDLRTFVTRTQASQYSLVVTAPHFARLAQKEAGYKPLLRAKRDLQGVILVSAKNGVRGIGELRGKTIAMPDSLAIITEMGLGLLKEHDLVPGRDIKVLESISHNSAALAVTNGTAEAAIISSTVFLQLPEDQKQGLRILAQTSSVPHVMFLSGPDVSAKDSARFAELLLHFVDQTEEGRQFIGALGYQGLRAPTEQELRSLDSYVDGLKSTLSSH